MTHAERLGWKAGFGTTAAMEMLGTTGPLAAPLTTATLVADGGSQSIEGWARPILEAELAVRIGPDGEVEAVAAAIELVDLHGPLARISKQRIGTWLGVQANWKRSGRPFHQGIWVGGRFALRMIGL